MKYSSVRVAPLSSLSAEQRAAVLEAQRAFRTMPFELQAFLAATERCNRFMNGKIVVVGEVNHE